VNQQGTIGGGPPRSDKNLEIPPLMFRTLALLFLALLASCSTRAPEGAAELSPQITWGSKPLKPVYGKGLNGRMVDGVKVYTVTVALYATKEGKVEHAEVVRSDAPLKLQWVSVRAVRTFKLPPMKRSRILYQTFYYKGYEVKPD
jgi:hypothetical protein